MKQPVPTWVLRMSVLMAIIIAIATVVAVINPRMRSMQSSMATVTPTPAAIYIHGRGPSSASSPLPIVAGATRQYYFPIYATPNPNVSEEYRLDHLREVRPNFICNAIEAVAFVKEKTNTDNWVQFIAKRTSRIQLERWQDGLEPIDPAMENSPLVWIVGFETQSPLTRGSIYGWLPGDHAGVSKSRHMHIVFSEEKQIISASSDAPSYSRETGNEIFPYSGFAEFPDLPSQAESQEPYFNGLCSIPLP